MARSNRAEQFFAMPIVYLMLAGSANAADLSGVWTTNVSMCDKIFVKKAAKISFRNNSDIYGSGFIIDKNKIRAKTATCDIKLMKEDGPLTHLITACATEIMLIDVQFSIKIIDANTIARVFPGLPELDSKYGRCEM